MIRVFQALSAPQQTSGYELAYTRFGAIVQRLRDQKFWDGKDFTLDTPDNAAAFPLNLDTKFGYVLGSIDTSAWTNPEGPYRYMVHGCVPTTAPSGTPLVLPDVVGVPFCGPFDTWLDAQGDDLAGRATYLSIQGFTTPMVVVGHSLPPTVPSPAKS